MRRLEETFPPLKKTALDRHRREHIPPTLAESSLARELAHGEDLGSRVGHLVRRAERLLGEAESALDAAKAGNSQGRVLESIKVACLAHREVRNNLELLWRAVGNLESVNIASHPDWVALRDRILGALVEFPEARQALIKAISGDTNSRPLKLEEGR